MKPWDHWIEQNTKSGGMADTINLKNASIKLDRAQPEIVSKSIINKRVEKNARVKANEEARQPKYFSGP